jgi:hypothetical protein
MSGVFIASKNEQNMYVVEPVPRIDQVYSYYAFMSNPEIPQLHFNYPTSSTPIKYTIKQYIDQTSGNPGRFCVYTSASPGQRILSDNKEALDAYVKNQNRMMSDGGNRTKRTRKTKRSKRAHTSKRK